MRGVADRQFTEPSELESLFQECIDKVKQDISERRKHKEDYHKSLQPQPKKNKPSAQIFADTYMPVKVEDFNASDRRKVYELTSDCVRVACSGVVKTEPGCFQGLKDPAKVKKLKNNGRKCGKYTKLGIW